MSNNRWSNKFSFIITTSAFAIGLGNVWRFPYVVGEGGGGAFLLVYLVLIAVIGIPMLTVEIALGRMSGTSILLGFGKLARKSKWNALGWLGVASGLMIMGFYVMIMAWIAIYLWECLFGEITSLPVSELSAHFDGIASQLVQVAGVILAIMITAFLVVKKGLKAGLERYTKAMMLGLIIIIIGFAIWAATLDGALEGYRWFLYPDFSKVNFKVIMNALGQLFFSIGVGMGVNFVFGSYIDKRENLVSSTVWIVLSDTFFAILSGLMLFPIIFSFNLVPDSGPNLIFVTMASVFNTLSYGWVLGSIFFLLLFLAGFSSLISTMQGLKDSFKDKYRLSDTTALFLVTVAIFLISIPVVLSYTENPLQLFGKTVFTLLDYVTSTIMLPLGGLLTVIFAGYVIGFERLKSHLVYSNASLIIHNYWKPILLIILPATVLLILCYNLLTN